MHTLNLCQSLTFGDPLNVLLLFPEHPPEARLPRASEGDKRHRASEGAPQMAGADGAGRPGGDVAGLLLELQREQVRGLCPSLKLGPKWQDLL